MNIRRSDKEDYEQGYTVGKLGAYKKVYSLHDYGCSQAFIEGWVQGNAEYKTKLLLQGKPI
jgi:hypothetical protein